MRSQSVAYGHALRERVRLSERDDYYILTGPTATIAAQQNRPYLRVLEGIKTADKSTDIHLPTPIPSPRRTGARVAIFGVCCSIRQRKVNGPYQTGTCHHLRQQPALHLECQGGGWQSSSHGGGGDDDQ